jgi:hypothetical protein
VRSLVEVVAIELEYIGMILSFGELYSFFLRLKRCDLILIEFIETFGFDFFESIEFFGGNVFDLEDLGVFFTGPKKF